MSMSQLSPIDKKTLALEIASLKCSHGLSHIGLRQASEVFLTPNHTACMGFTNFPNAALALGPPCGEPDDSAVLLKMFMDYCSTTNKRAVICGLPEDTAIQARNLGFKTTSIGDEAIVDPTDVDLKGKRWKEARAAINRSNRHALRFTWATKCTQDLSKRLHEISADWMATKSGPSFEFALGNVDSLNDPKTRLGIASTEGGDPVGFVTWVPIPTQSGWMLELLRFTPGIMAGLADYLIASSLLRFKREGIRHASLSGTPLATGVGSRMSMRNILKKTLSMAKVPYRFDGLQHFKAKFNPQWRELYIGYTGILGLPKALLAVLHASAPTLGVRGLLIRKLNQPSKIRSNVKPIRESHA